MVANSRYQHHSSSVHHRRNEHHSRSIHNGGGRKRSRSRSPLPRGSNRRPSPRRPPPPRPSPPRRRLENGRRPTGDKLRELRRPPPPVHNNNNKRRSRSVDRPPPPRRPSPKARVRSSSDRPPPPPSRARSSVERPPPPKPSSSERPSRLRSSVERPPPRPKEEKPPRPRSTVEKPPPPPPRPRSTVEKPPPPPPRARDEGEKPPRPRDAGDKAPRPRSSVERPPPPPPPPRASSSSSSAAAGKKASPGKRKGVGSRQELRRGAGVSKRLDSRLTSLKRLESSGGAGGSKRLEGHRTHAKRLANHHRPPPHHSRPHPHPQPKGNTPRMPVHRPGVARPRRYFHKPEPPSAAAASASRKRRRSGNTDDGDKKTRRTTSSPLKGGGAGSAAKAPLKAGSGAGEKFKKAKVSNSQSSSSSANRKSPTPGASTNSANSGGAGSGAGVASTAVVPKLASTSSSPKLSWSELTEPNTTADDYDELTKVERWVRSAPDELYYTREVDGYAVATERTRTLCDKFTTTLVQKCQVAREEAERLGHIKMQELIKLENAQIAEQKAAAKLKRQQLRAEGKCCHHSHQHSNKKIEDKPEEKAEKEKEDEVKIQDESKETATTTAEAGEEKSVEKSVEKESDSCSSSNSASKCDHSSSSSSSSSSDDSSSEDEDGVSMTRSDTANRELERRKKHPRRMHEELWHNDPGLMNDGPVCRCSAKARRFGIRHGYYPGESPIPTCDPFSNNKPRLFHYRITISPPKNFLISTPTVINHDGHEYIFEGFSIFSHHVLDLTLPPCKVIRFNIKYDVFVEEERFPESFCVRELRLFETYLFREILELVDLKYDWGDETQGCAPFHLMPRFVRQLPDNGQEVLSMSRVLIHLLKGDRELVKEEDLHKLYTVEQSEWQNFADRHKGTIVTQWGMKPCALRVDQIDRDISGQEVALEDGIPFPLIVHFGIRPPQLSYAGNASYQRAWRRYVKYRHLLSNMPKPSPADKLKLLQKEMKLQAMRTASNMKRDVTVAISAKGFRTTGICCDLVQHAMLVPVLVAHLRFHKCLETLETRMVYTFQNRYLLQLAMTHPSYRENFGTNPDHARNALTNCGIRQPEYGDRRIHYASTRKRGINTLINIMAKFGADQETESEITHNERLEFLGDAVVEFTTSIHLFHIFPDLEEGGLATYRAAIVQNQHLAVLAQTLNLDQYMLYAHGSDLCHDSELRHAMANCFEALMGALFLDGNICAADRVFGATLFGNDPQLLELWAHYPKHPLQQEELQGDRHWVQSHEVLQKLAEFEQNIGVQFNHIRLLARAFTDRSLGYNNLTKGSNQRLEFLGDTVLQLISSEYLYRHFPDHHEGHLSLLRSSLVNNRTQSHVCEDLGMPQYAMRGDPKSDMKTKDKADLLEAFLGALFIDKGLKYCITFCQVCFFPRLSNSITKQEWNDPKSKLQQCCLTLRAMDGREPDIPVYKVTESLGPTNTRTYIVAVYFRGKRLATAQGHSIQEAEMNAAAEALECSGHLFPQLHHQRRIMDKTSRKGH